MAEAHEAVAFAFQITHEGVDVNFDWEVLKLVWNSGVRSYKKRLARFKNSVKAGVYPAPMSSWMLTFAITCGLSMVGIDFFGFIDRLSGLSPLNKHLFGLPLAWFASCTIVGTLWWVGVILFFRYTLKILLLYKGWMFELRGQGMSLKSKLWMALLRPLANVTKPMLYSYQQSLPRLPLPSVEATIERYLDTVQPLQTDEEFEETKRLAEEFKNGIGKKLQRYLWLKSWWSTNYVSDWWEEYVYLRGRSPLMVNSNFYCIDMLKPPQTRVQAARAASLVYSALLFRRELDRQEMEPIMIYKMVPLCSSQYERLFNTTRVPGVEADTIVHRADADHIAVLHKGRIFKVLVHHRGRLLKPCEIELQLQKIIDSPVEPEKGEVKLPALTAGDRAHWAKAREAFFSRGLNKASLNTIESAAFFLTLDDTEFEYDPNDHTKLDAYAHHMLTGSGCDKWFDKTFTLVVGKNARTGFNAEHSWADAPIMGHLWEYMVATELADLSYKEDGHCSGEPAFTPPEPVKLKWQMDDECIDAIETSYKVAKNLADDLDLRLYVHDMFGKGAIKKCRLSPDAFVQMALQLASYRDSGGKFFLTYEASMTRMFREGRTETVRSCSIESSKFVLAMEDASVSASDRYHLLKDACHRHQLSYQRAMVGEGVDRHLFCLYVVSRYLEAETPFLSRVLGQPWRLSTSQTPHGQTAKMDLLKNPSWISAGGGFGPVTDDGYGVSYIVAGEDVIFFHISSKKSSTSTNSSRFAERIRQALIDIKELCGGEIKLQQQAKLKELEANGDAKLKNGAKGDH